MAKRKEYSPEFKQEALRLIATSGKSVAQVAKDLGVNENTLHQWRRHAISDGRMPVDENETPEQKIRRLERELKLVTEERDIIKKAIA